MKKKIVGLSIVAVILTALLGVGIFMLVGRDKKITLTGNLTDIEWYDVSGKEFTITTPEELYEFAFLSDFYTFEGQTIKLGADIVVNSGNAEDWAKKAPVNKWTPIKNFAGTFDGQGHTISGIYGKGQSVKMALFTDTTMDSVITNVRLVNSYFETKGFEGTASFASQGSGSFSKLYSDAIIHHSGENAAGIVSTINSQATLDQCWFDGEIVTDDRDAGGIVDEILGARVTFKHCLFSGSIASSYDFGGTRTGGLCGRVDQGATIIVNDCLMNGQLTANKTVYTGSLFGATYSGTKLTVDNTFVSTSVYSSMIGESGNKGAFTGFGLNIRPEELVGVKAYQWTTLDFSKYWAPVENSGPVLQCFAENPLSTAGVEKAFDISWYNPSYGKFTLTNMKQMYGLYLLCGKNSFEGLTVQLGKDLVVNEGKATSWTKNGPENPWYPITNFKGTFDGQGHTISGIYMKTDINYVGVFGQLLEKSSVKNLNIKNCYFENTNDTLAMMGSVAGETRGSLDSIYSDAILVSTGNQVGGIVARLNDMEPGGVDPDKVSVTNCWFDGKVSMKGKSTIYAGGIAAVNVQGDVDIAHCLNTGSLSSEADKIGLHLSGILGATWNAGTLNISDTLSAGVLNADYKICVGSVLGRSNHDNRVINITNTYATKESYGTTISNNSFKGQLNGFVVQLPEKFLTGNKAYQFTDLDFPNYWALTKESTPILQTFATSDPSTNGLVKVFDLSWYKQDAKSYVLKDAKDLYGFAMIASGNNFAEKTVSLGADIPVDSSVEFMPIGSYEMPFAGTFNGQGHTISGVRVESDKQYVALFGVTTPASMLKNFRLTDSTFTYNGPALDENGKEIPAYAGSICGDLRGDMDTVYSNATVSSTASRVGGLVAVANGQKVDDKYTTSTINNCWFDGKVELKGETARYAGGIAAIAMQGNVEITHCLNTGSVSNERDNAGQFLGGILGTDWTACNVKIADCFNAGKISTADKNTRVVGSILGRVNKVDSNITITDTYATSESFGVGIGGIIDGGKVNGSAIALDSKHLIGNKGYQFTSLDFANYWATVVNPDGTPILKSFASSVPAVAGERMLDTSWYSADAKELIIDSVKDMYGFAALSKSNNFKGQTVKLAADITLDKSIEWLTIGSTKTPFAGTFDGQNHTVSGVTIAADDTALPQTGFFNITASGSTVKNLRLTDSTISYNGTKNCNIGSVAGEVRGTLENVYSNATVTSNRQQVGGLVGAVNAHNAKSPAVVKNCWFDGVVSTENTIAGGIAGVTTQNDVTIQDCLNTGKIATTSTANYTYLGGILGKACSYNSADGTTLVDGCFSAPTEAIVGKNAGSLIGGINVEGKGKHEVAITDGLGTRENGTSDTVGAYGNAATKESTQNESIQIWDALLTGKEGYAQVGEGWLAIDGSIPVQTCFKDLVDAAKIIDTTGAIVSDTSWYWEDKKAEEFHIKTAEELYGLASLINGNLKLNKVLLDNDIELNDVNNGIVDTTNIWTPMGAVKNPTFVGTFDGQGHTISGMYIDAVYAGEEAFIGLFGWTGVGSVIQNLYLEDSVVTYSGSKGYTGSIAGEHRGTIQNVYSDADVTSSNGLVGGLVGRMRGISGATATVDGCWFDGKVASTKANVGGIAGAACDGNLIISNSLNTGSISCDKASGEVNVGGILGVSGQMASSAVSVRVMNCLSVPTEAIAVQTDVTRVGAVVGMIQTPSAAGASKTREHVIGNTYASEEGYSGKTAIGKNDNLNSAYTKVYAKSELTGMKGYRLAGTKWAAIKDEIPVPKYFKDAVSGEKLDTTGILTYDTSWYNASNMQIDSSEGFYGFMLLAQEDVAILSKTISLANDVVINEVKENTLAGWKNGEKPKNPWTPIGDGTNLFTGTFNGQGFTIQGVCVDQSRKASRVGLFGVIAVDGTVKDFQLKDSYFYTSGETGVAGYAYLGSVAGECRGTVKDVYSNATIETIKPRTGGIVGVANCTDNNKSATVSGCWFDGEVKTSAQYAGGIVGFVVQKKALVEHCLFTGEVNSTFSGSNYSFAGGLVGGNNGNTNITIDDSLSAGELTVTKNSATGSVIGYVANSGAVCTITDTYATKECFVKGNSSVAVGGCGGNSTVTRKLNGATVSVDSNILVNANDIKGTAARTTLPYLDYYNYWVTRENNVPGLSAIVNGNAKIRADKSWYNASSDSFVLEDESDLYGFAQLVNEGTNFSTKTVTLGKDMVLNEIEAGTLAAWEEGTETPINVWTPIGSSTKKFQGIFNGQGYSISGVYVNSTASQVGLFGYGEDCKIMNFKLIDSVIKNSSSRTGGVIGNIKSSGTMLSDIYCNAYVTNTSGIVGGIVGAVSKKTEDGIIENCWFDGEVLMSSSGNSTDVGGILGRAEAGTISVKNCLNSGSVTNNNNNSNRNGTSNTGGIVGANYTSQTIYIENCLNVGNVSTPNRTTIKKGAGMVLGGNLKNAVANVSNTYSVTGTFDFCGFDWTGGLTKDVASTMLAENQLQGSEAETNASGLGYAPSGKWSTISDKTPVLSTFKEWWLGLKK